MSDLSMDYLLKLRLVVARVGEMDLAQWWNTKGQLGSVGSVVMQRGFRRTYHFAQARSVFAVATHRCSEIYDPPSAVTLWSLPAELEDEFALHWEEWIDDAEGWSPFFNELEECTTDLAAELTRLDLVSSAQRETVARLRRSAERRAVQVPGQFEATDGSLGLLALAFSRGEPAKLAVPYQAWSGGE